MAPLRVLEKFYKVQIQTQQQHIQVLTNLLSAFRAKNVTFDCSQRYGQL